MTPPRVTVVGSCMMDVVVRAPRLPRPGETVVGSSVSTFVGGKGNNQAVAAARLGAAASLIGKVGRDRFGAELLDYARAAGVDTSGVIQDPRVATGVAVPVVFDDGGNSIFAVPEANLALTPMEVEQHATAIRSAAALLLQFEVSMDATVAAARVASGAGVPVILNTAPFMAPPLGLLPLVRVLIANETEADGLCPGIADRVEQATRLVEMGPESVVITLGERGLVAASRLCEPFMQPAFNVTAVDSVGAGDAFCGALAVALAEGCSLPVAARFGQAAGALSVTVPGAARSLPLRQAVDRLLAEARPGG